MDAARVATFAQLKFQRSDVKARVFAWIEAVRGLESAARFSESNHGLNVGFDVVFEDRGLIIAMPLVVSLSSRGFVEKTGPASDNAVPNGSRSGWWSVFAFEMSGDKLRSPRAAPQ